MADQYRIKNWEKFQHYHDRNPPWIKLHVEILASEDWVMVDDASKLAMIVCMIVASKAKGVITDDPTYFRRVAYLQKAPNLKPLIECGFLEPVSDASKGERVLADARPEKEGEKSREEKKVKTRARDARFDEFWEACPKKTGKGAAEKAWARSVKIESPENLIAAMRRYAETQIGKDRAYVKTPGPWLNEKRWLDEGIAPTAPPSPEASRAAQTAWDGRAAPLVQEIGTAKFEAWFGGSEFEPGPPVKITIPTKFKLSWVSQHYPDVLKRTYGEFELRGAA